MSAEWDYVDDDGLTLDDYVLVQAIAPHAVSPLVIDFEAEVNYWFDLYSRGLIRVGQYTRRPK